MASYRVNINPAVLVWARETAGIVIEIAATRIGVKPERLHAWEQGELKPTVNQLRKCAALYKRPLATFYLGEPPRDVGAVHDFRTLPESIGEMNPPELIIEIRRAVVRRETAIQLIELSGGTAPVFSTTIDRQDNIQETADRIRDMLRIAIEDQFSWKDDYQAFWSWRSSIEHLGILVFQATRVDVGVMRGFSLSEKSLPVIVLNSSDYVRARIFTLLHELGHILLDEGGLCDLREPHRARNYSERAEIYCNNLAGHVLVPDRALLTKADDLGISQGHVPVDDAVKSMSADFRVSRQVILRRLRAINRISHEFYARKIAEYEAMRNRRSKPSTGGPPPASLALSRNGLPFTRLVLQAYYGDWITAADVSNYLSVKLKHLTEIEHKVG